MAKKIVAFDFDGVINPYKKGWLGIDRIPEAPLEGMKEAIAEIRAAGYRVEIFSTRCSDPKGINAIQSYLDKYEIVVDKVTAEKPKATVIIDDRALTFDGHPETLLGKINGFKPWNR